MTEKLLENAPAWVIAVVAILFGLGWFAERVIKAVQYKREGNSMDKTTIRSKGSSNGNRFECSTEVVAGLATISENTRRTSEIQGKIFEKIDRTAQDIAIIKDRKT